MIHQRALLRAAVAVLYWSLLLSVAFSVAGMAILRVAPTIAGRFGALLPWFMKGPTWVYLVTVPLVVFLLFGKDVPWRSRVLAVVLGSLIGFCAELLGTNTGYPFGAYSYTDFLAPKILGDVPYLIPLSWYATSLLAWDLANRLGVSRTGRVLTGAAFMVLWDLALDPAMVAAFPVWQWHVDGFLYGMPFLNLVGWFFTSMIILAAYEQFVGLVSSPSYEWTRRIWIASAALPLGMAAVGGMWLAVLIGGSAVAVPLLLIWLRERVGKSVVLTTRHVT